MRGGFRCVFVHAAVAADTQLAGVVAGPKFCGSPLLANSYCCLRAADDGVAASDLYLSSRARWRRTPCVVAMQVF